MSAVSSGNIVQGSERRNGQPNGIAMADLDGGSGCDGARPPGDAQANRLGGEGERGGVAFPEGCGVVYIGQGRRIVDGVHTAVSMAHGGEQILSNPTRWCEGRGGRVSNGVRTPSRSSGLSCACRRAASWANLARRRRRCHGGVATDSRRGTA